MEGSEDYHPSAGTVPATFLNVPTWQTTRSKLAKLKSDLAVLAPPREKRMQHHEKGGGRGRAKTKGNDECIKVSSTASGRTSQPQQMNQCLYNAYDELQLLVEQLLVLLLPLESSGTETSLSPSSSTVDNYGEAFDRRGQRQLRRMVIPCFSCTKPSAHKHLHL